MFLLVFLAGAAASFHAARAQCVGKCFPGNGLWQGDRMISISNEFADATEATSLTVFNYFAYAQDKEKFYGTGVDADPDGNLVEVKILELNGEVGGCLAHLLYFPHVPVFVPQNPPVQYVVVNGSCITDTPHLAHIVCVPGILILLEKP
jgi:hypothetical protein